MKTAYKLNNLGKNRHNFFVLLILARVSIAMLTAEKKILTQAQSTKTRTDKASIIEQVRTDILGKQAENNSRDVFASNLEKILKNIFQMIKQILKI